MAQYEPDLIGLRGKKQLNKEKEPKLNWVPFAASVLIYFISKAIAEYMNLPVDMYTTVIIITALFYYTKKALNKNTERKNNEL